MSIEEVRKSVLEEFGFQPTKDQSAALDGLLDFLSDNIHEEVFILRGYAGTGKTTLVSALIRFLDKKNYPCILMAPTGRAAKVLATYSNHNATTIHKKIYRQKTVDGSYQGFSLNDNLYDHALFFVDEASMISNGGDDSSLFGSGNLLNDLLRYVYSGQHCKLILMGDTAQLPPVGKNISPALDDGYINSSGFYVHSFELKEVLRQSENSLILDNATRLRNAIADGNIDGLPQLKVNRQDVIRLQGEELIERITQSYNDVGMDECRIVCRSNKRAVLYNKGIRSSILYKEEELSTGDLLLVAKNNYLWSQPYKEIPFIANGDLIEVVKVRKTMEMYGFRFADLLVRFPELEWEMEVRVLLDSLTAEAPALDSASQERLYQAVIEDYSYCSNRRDLFENIRKDPWFNALQVKYGYAMTCHKSQGGQWKHIYLDQGWVTDDMMGLEYYRWLYTAITRATEKVYLVNFDDKFIEKPHKK